MNTAVATTDVSEVELKGVKDYLCIVKNLFSDSDRGPLMKKLTIPTYQKKSVSDDGKTTFEHVAYQWSEEVCKDFNYFAEILTRTKIELFDRIFYSRKIYNRPNDYVIFSVPAILARLSDLRKN